METWRAKEKLICEKREGAKAHKKLRNNKISIFYLIFFFVKKHGNQFIFNLYTNTFIYFVLFYLFPRFRVNRYNF